MEPVVASEPSNVMEPMVVIERLSRSGEVLQRWRRPLAAGEALRLGRGYDCELMLDDPHVAALHLRLLRDADGKLWVQDSGSRNGLRINDDPALVERAEVRGWTRLRIGHSRLRIHDGLPVVEAERMLARVRLNWPGAMGWLLLASALGLLGDWLKMYGEFQPSALAIAILMGVLLTVVWSFGWSLANRLFAGELRFARHLRVAAKVSAAATVLILAISHLAFALSFEPLSHYAYGLYWLTFAGLCWLHLRVMGPAHPRMKAGVVLGMAMIAISVQTLGDDKSGQGGNAAPRYLGTLQPASLRLRPAQPMAEFLGDAAKLQAGLDRAREEDQPDASDAD